MVSFPTMSRNRFAPLSGDSVAFSRERFRFDFFFFFFLITLWCNLQGVEELQSLADDGNTSYKTRELSLPSNELSFANSDSHEFELLLSLLSPFWEVKSSRRTRIVSFRHEEGVEPEEVVDREQLGSDMDSSDAKVSDPDINTMQMFKNK